LELASISAFSAIRVLYQLTSSQTTGLLRTMTRARTGWCWGGINVWQFGWTITNNRAWLLIVGWQDTIMQYHPARNG
jgi:hypothetical protein